MSCLINLLSVLFVLLFLVNKFCISAPNVMTKKLFDGICDREGKYVSP